MDKLTRIQVFKRLAELGGFSAVARDLGFSQPAVSKAILALENELRVRLVNRSTRSVSLTEAGRRYYERCARILADLEEADASLESLRNLATGTLRVTAPVPFGLMFISPRMARFKAMHPGLSIDLNLSDQRLKLVERDVDVAIRLGPVRTDGLAARRLGSSPFICIASPDYLERHGTPEVPASLAGHNCVVYSNLERPLEWGFQGGAGKVTVVSNYQSNNLLALRDAVVAGIGIARLPLWMVDSEIKSGALQAILADFPPPSYEIHAVFPSARKIPAKTRLFVDFIREELQSVSYFLGVGER